MQPPPPSSQKLAIEAKCGCCTSFCLQDLINDEIRDEQRPRKRPRLESVVPVYPGGSRGRQGSVRLPLWVSGMAPRSFGALRCTVAVSGEHQVVPCTMAPAPASASPSMAPVTTQTRIKCQAKDMRGAERRPIFKDLSIQIISLTHFYLQQIASFFLCHSICRYI